MSFIFTIIIVYIIFRILRRYIFSVVRSQSEHTQGDEVQSQQNNMKKYVISDKDIVDAQFEEIKEKKSAE